MSKQFIVLLIVLFLVIISFWYFNNSNRSINKESLSTMTQNTDQVINYAAIGDSYTIGLGIDAADRWPNVLTNHLNESGLKVNLATNPSVSGYEVQDAIDRELPQIKNLRVDFVTVLIGANDNFRDTPAEVYKKDLQQLLDQLQPLLSNPKNIVLITIPDYSKSPAGVQYGAGGEISKGIEEYNKVIKEESEKRDLKVADIFPLSQTMTDPSDYISDGLHPSAKGYAKWEKVILPVTLNLLK